MDSVVFKGIKSSIGTDLCTDYLKAPSNRPNSSSNSVIICITTTFSLLNIDQNNFSGKNSTQFQYRPSC